MAKTVHANVLDGAFDVLDQADLMTVCSAQPTTYTEAITTFKLADIAMTPDTDFTKANGDTSGRKVTVGASVSGFQAVPAALDGETIDYAITDGTAWEEGYGVYTHTGTTLTRNLIASSTGSFLDLSGDAEIFSTISSESAEN